MIICKRPVPPDDHLQEAAPYGWSSAFLVVVVVHQVNQVNWINKVNRMNMVNQV